MVIVIITTSNTASNTIINHHRLEHRATCSPSSQTLHNLHVVIEGMENNCQERRGRQLLTGDGGLRCLPMCLASTMVTTPSSLTISAKSAPVKASMTGAGFARPNAHAQSDQWGDGTAEVAFKGGSGSTKLRTRGFYDDVVEFRPALVALGNEGGELRTPSVALLERGYDKEWAKGKG